MTDRILSPDGTQLWDGSSWVPAEPPAAPPAAAHVTAVLAPPVTETSPTSGLTDTWGNNKWAWMLALSPLAYILIAASEGDIIWVLALLFLGLATWMCRGDVKSLNARGVAAEQSFSAAVFLLYIIGAPMYLIHRTRRAGSTSLIPLTWFAAAALTLVISVVLAWANSPAVDIAYVEDQIEAELNNHDGTADAFVVCPEDAAYNDGDMVICMGSTPGDILFDVVLEMRNDGYFSWHIQE